jgi:hypothetical protein
MKARTNFFVICALFFAFNSLGFAGDYLQFQDPQNTWSYDKGIIDTAKLTIRPQGAYCEYGLYLVFSGRELKDSSAQYEVQLLFSLNQAASLTDAKLWVGDTLVTAKLIDRWSAWKIYEGIVSRRRDPLVIYKNSATAYELRVYPLKKNMPRRIRITWLQPVDFSNVNAIAALPINIMTLSKRIPNLEVNLYEDSDWKNPNIQGISDVAFTNINHPDYGNVLSYTIPSANVKGQLNLTYDSPLRDGLYYKIFPTSATEGYYQFAYNPRAFINKAKKLLVLIDYNKLSTNVSINDLFSSIQATMKATMKATDSFNIIVSSFDFTPVQKGWISASSGNIDAAFASESVKKIAQYSLLPLLLNEGINFIGDDPKASIILFSSSYNERNVSQANQMIADLDTRMSRTINFYIGDYANKDVPTTKGPNGENYMGNDYFFSTLAKMSNGFYINLAKASNNIFNLTNAVFNQSDGVFFAFSMFVSATDGLTYSQYSSTNIDEAIIQGKPIIQFGKYIGKLPLNINASGVFGGELFNKSIALPNSDINAFGTKKMWTLNYILSLESKGEVNEIINEIIKTSMDNRILSRYTAFLALEPWMIKQQENDSIAAANGSGGGGNTSVEILGSNSNISIQASPNPFQNNVAITIDLANKNINQYVIQVYDVLGNCVKSFDLSKSTISGNCIVLNWDGTDTSGKYLLNGSYLLVIRSPQGTQTFKLIINR